MPLYVSIQGLQPEYNTHCNCVATITEIMDRLLESNKLRDKQWRVFIKWPEKSAYVEYDTYGYGAIYISHSLLHKRLNSDHDAIVFILAHEMAHIILHSYNNFFKFEQMCYAEKEADAYGARLAINAGYSLTGFINYFRDRASRIPSWKYLVVPRTHPLPEDRIRWLEQLIK